VARLPWAIRLGSRAARIAAAQAAGSPKARRATAKTEASSRSSQPTVGTRAAKRSAVSSRTPNVLLAALRATTFGTTIGVLELKCSELRRSVAPSSTRRLDHSRWSGSS
jgi:hypothetical protein